MVPGEDVPSDEEAGLDDEYPDSDADGPIRSTLRGDGGHLRHCLTHQPADPKRCNSCMRGKTKNRRKLAGRSTRDPKEFGDLVTVGHVYTRDSHGRSGVGGYTDSLTLLDVGTGCKYSEPVDTLDAAETARILQHLRGGWLHPSRLFGQSPVLAQGLPTSRHNVGRVRAGSTSDECPC